MSVTIMDSFMVGLVVPARFQSSRRFIPFALARTRGLKGPRTASHQKLDLEPTVILPYRTQKRCRLCLDIPIRQKKTSKVSPREA